jgi:putative membrane protein|tara:strand:+ start:62 stop:496 length:435 start_codon:yes stop_codon:yes gene_type:complete
MNTYLLLKSLHLIAVISWMAGLLYLPRIFVYHVENSEKKEITEIFEIMEKRLYFYIMRPAMVLTWLFGIILIHNIGHDAFTYLWLQVKLFLIILLTIYHEYLGKCLKMLKLGTNKRSPKFFRIINEIPTVLLIFIVFVIIFKPL